MKRRNKKSLKVRKVTIKQLSVDSLDLADGGGAGGGGRELTGGCPADPNGARGTRACY